MLDMLAVQYCMFTQAFVCNDGCQKNHRGYLGLGGSVHEEAHRWPLNIATHIIHTRLLVPVSGDDLQAIDQKTSSNLSKWITHLNGYRLPGPI